jgi:hypothetical protein
MATAVAVKSTRLTQGEGECQQGKACEEESAEGRGTVQVWSDDGKENHPGDDEQGKTPIVYKKAQQFRADGVKKFHKDQLLSGSQGPRLGDLVGGNSTHLCFKKRWQANRVSAEGHKLDRVGPHLRVDRDNSACVPNTQSIFGQVYSKRDQIMFSKHQRFLHSASA